MFLFPTRLVSFASTTFPPNRSLERGKDAISLTTGDISIELFRAVMTGMPSHTGGLDPTTSETNLPPFIELKKMTHFEKNFFFYLARI